jgi:hypothetical protein
MGEEGSEDRGLVDNDDNYPVIEAMLLNEKRPRRLYVPIPAQADRRAVAFSWGHRPRLCLRCARCSSSSCLADWAGVERPLSLSSVAVEEEDAGGPVGLAVAPREWGCIEGCEKQVSARPGRCESVRAELGPLASRSV